MNLKTYKKSLLNNPDFKREYYTYDLAFEIAQMLIEARSIKGITQKKLAEMVNTKQSGIARAENGKTLPSLSFLNKIAGALRTHLIVRFGFMEKYEINKVNPVVSSLQTFEQRGSIEEPHSSYLASLTLNHKSDSSQSLAIQSYSYGGI